MNLGKKTKKLSTILEKIKAKKQNAAFLIDPSVFENYTAIIVDNKNQLVFVQEKENNPNLTSAQFKMHKVLFKFSRNKARPVKKIDLTEPPPIAAPY